MLDLLVHVGEARTRAEAARVLERDGINLHAKSPRFLHPQQQTDIERVTNLKRDVAAALWRASGPLTATTAEAYLRGARGVVGPLRDAELRFLGHTSLTPYRPGGRTAPALIARVVDSVGRGVGVHLTFLRPDGSGKADFDPARKAVGTLKGGAVKLRAGIEGVLVAEGLESALSAADALDAAEPELARRLEVMAALSASGMATLPLRPDWRTLVISPDCDVSGTGELAAAELAKRAWCAGRDVRWWRPPAGCGDWNDAARHVGGER